MQSMRHGTSSRMTEPKKRGGQPVPPELQRVRVNARIPRWLNDWITATGSAGAAIEAALIKANRLKAPANKTGKHV